MTDREKWEAVVAKLLATTKSGVLVWTKKEMKLSSRVRVFYESRPAGRTVEIYKSAEGRAIILLTGESARWQLPETQHTEALFTEIERVLAGHASAFVEEYLRETSEEYIW